MPVVEAMSEIFIYASKKLFILRSVNRRTKFPLYVGWFSEADRMGKPIFVVPLDVGYEYCAQVGIGRVSDETAGF